MGNTCKPPRNNNHHHGIDGMIVSEQAMDAIVNAYSVTKTPAVTATTATAESMHKTCQLCGNDDDADDSDNEDKEEQEAQDESTSSPLQKEYYDCATCQTTYCFDCCQKWILACQEQRLAAPTCPNCRATLPAAQVRVWLHGKPYTPAAAPPQDNTASHLVPLDSDLQAAMHGLGYRQCTNCQAWMERENHNDNDVAAIMECLCGERFCFDCGLSLMNRHASAATGNASVVRTCQCLRIQDDEEDDTEEEEEDYDDDLDDEPLLVEPVTVDNTKDDCPAAVAVSPSNSERSSGSGSTTSSSNSSHDGAHREA